MKKLRTVLASLLIAPIFSACIVGTAMAWSPFAAVPCNGSAKTSAVCQDKNTTTNPISGSDGLLMKITNIIAVIAGIAAVIIIIVAGMRFVTSGGSSEGVAGARRAIIYSVVGLIVIVLARSLIGLVLSKL